MLTSSALLRSIRGRFGSAVTTFFVARSSISRTEARTPKVAPTVNMATVVTVVVTEDIMVLTTYSIL